MEGLLREEMTVTGVEVDGVVPTGHLVAAVVRDPDEIRCARSHGRAERRTENPSKNPRPSSIFQAIPNPRRSQIQWGPAGRENSLPGRRLDVRAEI